MRRLLLLIFATLTLVQLNAQFTASGGSGTPYNYNTGLTGTGLSTVYIFNTLGTATLRYQSSGGSVTFFSYQNSSADKVAVPAADISQSGSVYTISNLQDGRGYIAQDDSNTSAVKVIDYNMHRPSLNSISPVAGLSDECDLLKLAINTSISQLLIYGTSGVPKVIPRTFTISYHTMHYNSQQKKYVDTTIVDTRSVLGVEEMVSAPLKNTKFVLSGDQFAQHFNIDLSVQSPLYEAIAVKGHIAYERESDGGSNIPESSLGALDGAAPAIINFYGSANEPLAAYYTWLIFNATDLKNPIARYTDKNIRYEFDHSGKYQVMLEVANSTSSCVDTVRFDTPFTFSE